MTHSLVLRPDSCYQHHQPQSGRPFMQNTFNQKKLFEPIKPIRRRRKRKFEDIDHDIIQNDDNQNNEINDDKLLFMKPSNKRRRTNEMNGKQTPTMIVSPELQQNIYCNPLQTKQQKHEIQKLHKNDKKTDENTSNYRNDSPYNHLVHPYLRNKKNKNNNERDKSPEMMLSKLNLNGFKMSNKGIESVNDWKNSIESQLNAARNQPTNIEELCNRIRSSSGLGRDVLMAKLRKSLSQNEFDEICGSLDWKC